MGPPRAAARVRQPTSTTRRHRAQRRRCRSSGRGGRRRRSPCGRLCGTGRCRRARRWANRLGRLGDEGLGCGRHRAGCGRCGRGRRCRGDDGWRGRCRRAREVRPRRIEQQGVLAHEPPGRPGHLEDDVDERLGDHAVADEPQVRPAVGATGQRDLGAGQGRVIVYPGCTVGFRRRDPDLQRRGLLGRQARHVDLGTQGLAE